MKENHKSVVIDDRKWSLLVDPKPGLTGAWITAEELGMHLEYRDPRQSVLNIYSRNASSFEKGKDTAEINMISPSGTQKHRIFSQRGALMVTRYSKQPRADEIIKTVFDVFIAVANDPKRLAREFLKQELRRCWIETDPNRWHNQFPNSLAQAAGKMYGIPVQSSGDPHPALSQFYATYIYGAAPEGIYQALLEQNPVTGEGKRRYKHHQFMKEEAKIWLGKQMATVETLVKAARFDRERFKSTFFEVFPKARRNEVLDLAVESLYLQATFDF